MFSGPVVLTPIFPVPPVPVGDSINDRDAKVNVSEKDWLLNGSKIRSDRLGVVERNVPPVLVTFTLEEPVVLSVAVIPL